MRRDQGPHSVIIVSVTQVVAPQGVRSDDCQTDT
jgi:hypothetical protein